MRKRISDSALDSLIDNEGTVDGINVPNVTGILRLALDLRNARQELNAIETEIERAEKERRRR